MLPGRLASDIVRALPDGSVSVEVTDDEARISAARSEFSLRVLPADEFPRLTEAAGEPVTLASTELATALTQVVRAASSDDARPILTGVLLAAEAGGLRLVATDSYRLAIRDLPGTTVLSEGQHVLVPSRALQELARLLSAGDAELSVRLGEREASFEVGGTRLTTVLIEGEFPPYERLIPQAQPNRLTVGREVLLEAVRRVKLLAREATPLRLAMSSDGLELVAVTQDVGQAHESLDAKFEGTDLTVAFQKASDSGSEGTLEVSVDGWTRDRYRASERRRRSLDRARFSATRRTHAPGEFISRTRAQSRWARKNASCVRSSATQRLPLSPYVNATTAA